MAEWTWVYFNKHYQAQMLRWSTMHVQTTCPICPAFPFLFLNLVQEWERVRILIQPPPSFTWVIYNRCCQFNVCQILFQIRNSLLRATVEECSDTGRLSLCRDMTTHWTCFPIKKVLIMQRCRESLCTFTHWFTVYTCRLAQTDESPDADMI